MMMGIQILPEAISNKKKYLDYRCIKKEIDREIKRNKSFTLFTHIFRQTESYNKIDYYEIELDPTIRQKNINCANRSVRMCVLTTTKQHKDIH